MSCRDAYAYGCGCVTVTLPMRDCDAIQVGDFQVATAGGVWVAVGEQDQLHAPQRFQEPTIAGERDAQKRLQVKKSVGPQT